MFEIGRDILNKVFMVDRLIEPQLVDCGLYIWCFY